MSPPPKAPRQRVAEGGLPPLQRRNPREALTVTIVYRGGAECWYEVRARGRIWRRPGSLCLHDVFDQINEGTGGRVP